MSAELERTCWRGIEVQHPPGWEPAVVCGPDESGRLTFADRHFHRLDVRWKPLKYVPNIELILTRHKRRDAEDETKISQLNTAPAPWKGVIHKPATGTVVHAVRFFRGARMLVEASIIWPQGRDMNLESRLLASISAAEPDAANRLWQAMGLSVTCPSSYELTESGLDVGRLRWDFATARPRKPIDADENPRRAKDPQLRIERIAMPHYWLGDTPLREWLGEQIPAEFRQLRTGLAAQGQHMAERIVSVAKAPLIHRVRGFQRLRLDLAWLCDRERRVYHVQMIQPRRDEDIRLPNGWSVRCCRTAPPPADSESAQ